ncbi:MlaE family lipid ABC transporter permease subunit [bacterium]|nr:MlaE family lipid ABC transporter permease subunit [bacterium]
MTGFEQSGIIDEQLSYSLLRTNTTDRLRLVGVLDRKNVSDLLRLVQSLQVDRKSIALDLSGIASVDSAGVAFLAKISSGQGPVPCSVLVHTLTEKVRKTLALYPWVQENAQTLEIKNVFETVAERNLDRLVRFRDFLQLAADCTIETIRDLMQRGVIRWHEYLAQSIQIGSQALPIVALISLLVGLTLAFQSAFQLRLFGVDIYVAKMTGIAMIREMGPLMTAILVAGRSGSAIAAEIATMKVAEEIDALKVMGIDPLHFLAIPRLLAMVTMVPLLAICAIAIGIGGGFLVGVYYVGLAPISYLNQTIDALIVKDLISCLLKSGVFAWGIALIGLYYGFSVFGGAEQVGRATTTSVVVSIFFIVAADCVFSVLFYILI